MLTDLEGGVSTTGEAQLKDTCNEVTVCTELNGDDPWVVAHDTHCITHTHTHTHTQIHKCQPMRHYLCASVSVGREKGAGGLCALRWLKQGQICDDLISCDLGSQIRIALTDDGADASGEGGGEGDIVRRHASGERRGTTAQNCRAGADRTHKRHTGIRSPVSQVCSRGSEKLGVCIACKDLLRGFKKRM